MLVQAFEDKQRTNKSIFLEPRVESGVYDATPLLQDRSAALCPRPSFRSANAGELQQDDVAEDAERYFAEETTGKRFHTTSFCLRRYRDNA